jgi:hypothetical protein
VIAIIVYLVNLEDEEYPDAPAPAPAPDQAPVLTAEDVRAIVAENNSQLSATDIATIVAAGNSGSNGMSTKDLADILAENNASTLQQILQIIEDRSDDGGGVNIGGGGVNRCKDIKQYKNAKECEDINSDSEAEEKCKEGRWVNSASREKKAVLCKWDNNDGCVTDSDCESDSEPAPTPADDPADENTYTVEDINFCQKMIDEKEVIPIGVDGATGGTMNDEDRDKYTDKQCNNMYRDNAITYPPVDTPVDGDIDYCKMITNIRPLIDEVNIEKDTLKNYERKLKSTGSRGGGWKEYRDRKSVRDDLRGELVNINRVLKSTYTDNDDCEFMIKNIITYIEKFNEFFNKEIEKTNKMTEDDNKYEYQYRDISFDTINWKFADVETVGYLQDVLSAESFKNYEPYHNGNSRSSRKVPKPYDEHFVNFRSY